MDQAAESASEPSILELNLTEMTLLVRLSSGIEAVVSNGKVAS